jgi:hypothetical protein
MRRDIRNLEREQEVIMQPFRRRSMGRCSMSTGPDRCRARSPGAVAEILAQRFVRKPSRLALLWTVQHADKLVHDAACPIQVLRRPRSAARLVTLSNTFLFEGHNERDGKNHGLPEPSPPLGP